MIDLFDVGLRITQTSFFLPPIVRLYLSRLRFFRDRLERSLVYHENRVLSPDVSKIRKGRNTIYGQYAFLVLVDLHFSRLHVLPGKVREEGERTGIPISSISFPIEAIRGVATATVAAPSGKQTIAIMLSPEHEAAAQDLRENLRCLGRGPRRVTLIECKCCGKPKLFIRYGNAWERYRGLRIIPSTSKRQTRSASLGWMQNQNAESHFLDHFEILHYIASPRISLRSRKDTTLPRKVVFRRNSNFYQKL